MEGLYNNEFEALGFDSYGNMYAGSKSLMKSSDKGLTWSKINEISPYYFNSIFIKDSVIIGNKIYVNCDDEMVSDFSSGDLGVSQKKNPKIDSLINSINNKRVSFKDTLYQAMKINVLSKSTDNGITWIDIDSLENKEAYRSIQIDNKGNILFNNSYYNYNLIKFNLETYTKSNINFVTGSRENYKMKLIIDNYNNYIIAYTSNDRLDNTGALLISYSTNEGLNWQSIKIDYPIQDIILTKDNKLFVQTFDNGIFYTKDFGNTWVATPIKNKSYDKMILSPDSTLFTYGSNCNKYNYENNTWSNIKIPFDDLEVHKILEYNNNMYCSGFGINKFDPQTSIWESYFVDGLKYTNYIYNFIITNNTVIAVNGTNNICASDLDDKIWKKRSPIIDFGGFCLLPWMYKINFSNDLVCFSNIGGKHTFISTDSGDNWKDLSKMFDSSSVLNNVIDKNGILFIAKQSKGKEADSINSDII